VFYYLKSLFFVIHKCVLNVVTYKYICELFDILVNEEFIIFIVNVGITFSRWIELVQEKEFKRDAEVLLYSRQVSQRYKLFSLFGCVLYFIDRLTFIFQS